MRIRRAMAVCAAVAVVGTGTFAAGASSAHEPDQRLPPITLNLVRGKVVPLVTPATTNSLLSDRDRFALSDTRSKSMEVDIGPVALVASGSRMRTKTRKGGQFALRAPDRVSVFSAGMDAGVDLLKGMTLHAFTTAMRMKRRIDLMPGNGRSLNSSMMAFGVGLEQTALGSFMLDFTSNTGRGHRDTQSRMMEQVSGATPFGKGMRMALTNATATSDERGQLTWTVSATAVRRPMYDADFAASTHMLNDRRAEVALRFAL